MDYTWDLSPLYDGFDTDAFRADLGALDAVIASVNAFAAEAAADDANAFLHRYIDLYEQANTLAAKLICYTQLRSAANTADMEAAVHLGFKGNGIRIDVDRIPCEGGFQNITALKNKFVGAEKEVFSVGSNALRTVECTQQQIFLC